MKPAYVLVPIVLAFATAGHAQTRIWRCGNTYTNDEATAKVQNCKLMEGGNVTIVQGTRANGTAPASAPRRTNENVAAVPGVTPRVEANDQKARDNEARAILEAELKKAESRRTELLQEWNNGEPEMMGPEHKNHQKYLDRVAGLKAAIERNDQDIAGLKRELGRSSTNGNAAAR